MKTLQDELAEKRGEIETVSNEYEETESAPPPRDEAKARIAAVIGAPFNDQILSPEPAGLLNGSFNEAELRQMIERPALLLAVLPDALEAYLIGVYDAQLGDATPGLPRAERGKRLADLAAQKFKLEQEEEELIEQLEAQGADVRRRPAADPIAALGLADGPIPVRETTA